MVDKNCKYFRHEPYFTPNNFDVYIPIDEIPTNIPRENVPNLTNRLQKFMPPTKILHINFTKGAKTMTESNTFSIKSRLKINNREVKFI